MEAGCPALLGGYVSIGWGRALEEMAGVSDTGMMDPQKSLLGPSSWSFLYPPSCPPVFLPLMHNPWEGAQCSRRCTTHGNVHNPWEDPQPLGRFTTLWKIHSPWKGA